MRLLPLLMVGTVLLAPAGCKTEGQGPQPKRGGGARAVAERDRAEEAAAPTVYVDDWPQPAGTADEQARGFLLFSRPTTQPLFPAAVPQAGEIVSALRLAACPGETKSVVLAVWALKALTGVKVTVADLAGPAGSIAGSAVEVRSVRVMQKLGQPRWGPYQEGLLEVPLFLEQREALDTAAGTNQAFWLTLHVPDDAPAGAFSAAVSVAADGSPGAQLPLNLTVRPFRLAEPTGTAFGFYEKIRSNAAFAADACADMRAHGMTTVAWTGDSGLGPSADAGNVTVGWSGASALEVSMDAYAKADFPEPAVWLMADDILQFCQGLGPAGSPAFQTAYRQVVTAIVEHGKQAGWPEIIFQPVDEPFTDPLKVELAVELLRILRSIPGVRTQENAFNAPRAEPSVPLILPLVDIVTLHDGPVLTRGVVDLNEWRAFAQQAAADKQAVWFYNIDTTGWRPEPMRYMAGYGLRKTGATGLLQWAYMFAVNDQSPAAAYNQLKAALFRYPSGGGETGGPTVGYEGFREGIYDYRYLLTLDELADQVRRQGKAALANQALAPVRARLEAATLNNCIGKAAQGDWTGRCEMRPDGTRVVRGDLKIDNNLGFGDYDALRDLIAEGIEKLQTAAQ